MKRYLKNILLAGAVLVSGACLAGGVVLLMTPAAPFGITLLGMGLLIGGAAGLSISSLGVISASCRESNSNEKLSQEEIAHAAKSQEEISRAAKMKECDNISKYSITLSQGSRQEESNFSKLPMDVTKIILNYASNPNVFANGDNNKQKEESKKIVQTKVISNLSTVEKIYEKKNKGSFSGQFFSNDTSVNSSLSQAVHNQKKSYGAV